MTARHSSLVMATLLALLLTPAAGVSASLSASDSVHFCLPFDDEQWRSEHPTPAAKRAADLNVGEPRTVRLIYFLPNDWPYRAEVVDSMKAVIVRSQSFYREQMQSHGYGERTFAIETDAGSRPLVHRVDGRHPFSHYDNTLGNAVIDELEQTFDLDANIYFIVLGTDALRQGNGQPAAGVGRWRTKNGGNLMVTNSFGSYLVSHELGHAFGLSHDFRDNRHLMSYGPSRNRILSSCAAEYLAIHTYFNTDSPTYEGVPPTVELISPNRYNPGTTSVSVQLQVNDPDGVHQVVLFGRGFGGTEVVACRVFSGQRETLVEFDFTGAIPSDDATGLADSPAHTLYIEALDVHGDLRIADFTLAEISPSNIATWQAHTDWVSSVSFSPNGKMIVSGSNDRTFKLWDAATLTQVATLEARSWVDAVSFSPDGAILAIASSDVVKLWDVKTLDLIDTLEGHSSSIFSVSFSPDGKLLASGSHDNTVRLWDVGTRDLIDTLEGHSTMVTTVSFSPDGTLLASGSHDNTVRLWDVSTRRIIATFKVLRFGVWSVAFSPDGAIIAVATISTVELWDVARSERIASIKEWGGVNSVTYSPDGSAIASAAHDKTVKLWDAATRRNLATFPHTAIVTSVSFSSNRSTLAAGVRDGTIALWDVAQYIAPASPDPDFDADGSVGLGDFLLFAVVYGLSRGDARYDARFDLDGNGTIGFSDLLIFGESYGKSTS